MDCPVCDNELDALDRHKDRFENVKTFFCETCNIEYHLYPKENKKGVQMTGWSAYIPLKQFPEREWADFLLNVRNIYGEDMPYGMPSTFHPFITNDDEAIRFGKEIAAKRAATRESIRKKWQEKVG